jgi:hypothetical protein
MDRVSAVLGSKTAQQLQQLEFSLVEHDVKVSG